MLEVKVTTMGSSVGIVLPQEALNRLKASKGDVLYLVDSPEGLTITPYRAEVADQAEAAKRVMKEYRNALRRLAQ